MAVSYATRKALEYSAVFVESALRRAQTLQEREESLRQLHFLVANLREAGLDASDFRKFMPSAEKVFLNVWNEQVAGTAEGVDSNGTPCS